jgi:YbbR domain-containing protein
LFLALCLFLLVASLVWSNVFSTFTTGQDKSRVF